jgi:nitrite reductase (NADH) small subunit
VKHELFPVDELQPGYVRGVIVDGLKIAVARDHDGQFYALYDRCAHAGAPLSRGRLLNKVLGDDVDEYELADELVLRCPWHGYEFELSSGRCLADPKRIRVRTYEVVVEDDLVWLERRGGEPATASSPASVGADD